MSQIPIGWLINRGVWRNPFNNRSMMIDGIPNRHLYFYQKDVIDEERLPQKWHSRGVTNIALTDWSFFSYKNSRIKFLLSISDFDRLEHHGFKRCRFWIFVDPAHTYIYNVPQSLNWRFPKIGVPPKSSIFNHVHRISHELSHPVLAWGTSYGNLHCPSCVAQSTSGDWTDKAG